MPTWDWQHTNDIEIRMNPDVKPSTKFTGLNTVVRNPGDVRAGVCASKSYLWSKRCLTTGAPPASRTALDGDKTGGLGVTPASIVTQALHAFMQRQTAKLGYDPAVWNRDMARGHGLSVTSMGAADGANLSHGAYIDIALGVGGVVRPSLGGPYVVTVVGANYFHTMAFFSGVMCAFFDPEKGQFSAPRAAFRATALDFLGTDYPDLQHWDLWKPRLA
jgi:hypothetical protein